jgi:putative membrane protein
MMKLSLAGAAVVAVIAGCSHTSSSTINSASDMTSDAGMAMADAGMSSASGMGSMADAGMSSSSSMGSMADGGMTSASGSAMTAADSAKASAGSMASGAGSMAADAGSMAMDAADAGMAAAGTAASTTALTDAQIAGITAAAHKGEIDAAKMARKQSKNAKVKMFAAQMIKQHSSAVKMETDVESKSNITPADSDMSAKITQMNSDTADQLKGLKGKEFDKAYVKAQVDAHTKVLDSLDNVLIPAAQDPGLKAQLQKERPVVAMHLEHAKKLADAMGVSQ